MINGGLLTCLRTTLTPLHDFIYSTRTSSDLSRTIKGSNINSALRKKGVQVITPDTAENSFKLSCRQSPKRDSAET